MPIEEPHLRSVLDERDIATQEAPHLLDGGASDLTIGEIEHLMGPPTPVGDEIHNRGELPELCEMVRQLKCRLLDSDASEISVNARPTIPRLHELWFGTAQHFDLTADDSDDGDGIAAKVCGTADRWAAVCNSGPRLWASSRRRVILPVCWKGGAS